MERFQPDILPITPEDQPPRGGLEGLLPRARTRAELREQLDQGLGQITEMAQELMNTLMKMGGSGTMKRLAASPMLASNAMVKGLLEWMGGTEMAQMAHIGNGLRRRNVRLTPSADDSAHLNTINTQADRVKGAMQTANVPAERLRLLPESLYDALIGQQPSGSETTMQALAEASQQTADTMIASVQTGNPDLQRSPLVARFTAQITPLRTALTAENVAALNRAVTEATPPVSATDKQNFVDFLNRVELRAQLQAAGKTLVIRDNQIVLEALPANFERIRPEITELAVALGGTDEARITRALDALNLKITDAEERTRVEAHLRTVELRAALTSSGRRMAIRENRIIVERDPSAPPDQTAVLERHSTAVTALRVALDVPSITTTQRDSAIRVFNDAVQVSDRTPAFAAAVTRQLQPVLGDQVIVSVGSRLILRPPSLARATEQLDRLVTALRGTNETAVTEAVAALNTVVTDKPAARTHLMDNAGETIFREALGSSRVFEIHEGAFRVRRT